MFFYLSAQGQINEVKRPTDPCKQMKIMSVVQNNEALKSIAAHILTLQDGIEWGVNHNLDALPGKDNTNLNYKQAKVKQGITDTWDADFYWNPKDGYTIGRTYLHPGEGAPSPDDVFILIDQLNRSLDLAKSPKHMIDYYKSNVSTTVITQHATYVVMVRDWDELEKAFLTYNKDRKAYLDLYRQAASTYSSEEVNPHASIGEASSFALLMLLNKAIVLYIAPRVQSNVPLEFKFIEAGFDRGEPSVRSVSCWIRQRN